MIPFDTIKDLFFEIEIAPRSESLKKKNKKFIKLPEFLKRSVESMEVALVAEERGGAGATMTINFKERVMVAPQEQEALVKSGIVSGKSGYWLDLKFAEENSEEKYTLFTNSDLNKTYRQKRKESLESYKSTNKNLKDWQLDEIAEELEILDKELNYSKNNYILSPGNTIRLSWGYKGKLQSWQTAEYTVIMVKHNDSGSVPTTSVQCVDFTIAYLDYVTPFSGFSCTKEEIAAYLNKQNKIETESRSYKNKPATRYEVLQAICDMNNIDLYIGDLSLKEELQTKIEDELAVKNQQLIAEQINEGFQAKIAARINKKFEDKKKTLLPYVLGMLLEFGPTVAQQIVDKTFDPNNMSSMTQCPLPSTLEELIVKRNNLVQEINNSFEDVLNLTKALNITDIVIKAIQIGLILYQTFPYPATGIPPSLPPLTSGQIALINISIIVLQTLLAAADVAVDVLTVTLGEYGYFLALMLDYLNQLDTLLQFYFNSDDIVIIMWTYTNLW
jgi:hypothetical protein